MENAYGLSRKLYVDTILTKFNDIEIFCYENNCLSKNLKSEGLNTTLKAYELNMK